MDWVSGLSFNPQYQIVPHLLAAIRDMQPGETKYSLHLELECNDPAGCRSYFIDFGPTITVGPAYVLNFEPLGRQDLRLDWYEAGNTPKFDTFVARRQGSQFAPFKPTLVISCPEGRDEIFFDLTIGRQKFHGRGFGPHNMEGRRLFLLPEHMRAAA